MWTQQPQQQNQTANFVDSLAVTEFLAEMHHVAQGSSMLEHTVRTRRGVVGKTTKFKRMNHTRAYLHIPRTNVRSANPTYEEVECTMLNWIIADYADVFEDVQVNAEERTELAHSFRMAMGRQQDEVIRGALESTGSAVGSIGGPVSTVQVGSSANTKFSVDNYTTPSYGKVNRPSGLIAHCLGQLMDNEMPQNSQYFALLPAVWYPAFAADTLNISKDFGPTNLQRSGLMNQVIISQGIECMFMGDRKDSATKAFGDDAGIGEGWSSSAGVGYVWEKNSLGIGYGLNPELEVNYVPEKKSHLVTLGFRAGGCIVEPKGIVKITNGPTSIDSVA